METLLYKAWGESMDSYYEDKFYEPLVLKYVQYRHTGADKRATRARFFANGYEIYIYAFFLGLYMDERRPLEGPKSSWRNFRMTMNSWGRVKDKDRKHYDDIQDYIFTALVAKSDIDLIALDRGEVSVEECVKILMKTLCEYANAGFYAIMAKEEPIIKEGGDGYFVVEDNFFKFFNQICQ